MTCDHCNGAEIDGYVCAFCLGGDQCGAHRSRIECLCKIAESRNDGGNLTPPEQIAAAERMEAAGHTVFKMCGGCFSPCAQCDYPGCAAEAYKLLDPFHSDQKAHEYWVAGGMKITDSAFYYCEAQHGYDCWRPLEHFDANNEVLLEFEDVDDSECDNVIMYHPGSDAGPHGCAHCDFPY